MLEFLSVTLFILLAAMAPGADFAMVLRNALLYSRRAACLTALGIGTSMLVHASYSVLGLALIIARSQTLFTVIKFAGAAYLCWLGWQSWRGSNGPLTSPESGRRCELSDRRSFALGFFCNLLNPKAPLFFIAFYSVVVPAGSSPGVRALYGLECALVVGGWFVLLALIATQPAIKRGLDRAQRLLARALGAVMITFAIRLALTAS